MKPLFIVTALIESTTGLILLISPSFLAHVLLGSSVDSDIGLLLGRVAGSAILSLGVACWLAQKDNRSGAVKALATAMLLYNFIAAALFAYTGLNEKLSGLALWAVVGVHFFMAVWCIKVLATANIKE